MIRFERQDGAYRMRSDDDEIVAVHQVLTTPAARPVASVLRELSAGSIFIAQQAPAPNTYLWPSSALSRHALFPYANTLRGAFAGDRLTLIIREILEGRSRTEPIDDELSVPYCVRSGVIDELHIETVPEMHERYRSLLGSVTFHDRRHRVFAAYDAENRERL